MNIHKNKFLAQSPSFFPQLRSELEAEGFILTLVGGSVRDFILKDCLGHDWDLELSHKTLAFNKTHWKEVGKKLARFGRTQFLTYDVIRLEAEGYQLEFSPPRIETFPPDLAHCGHRNFTVEFDYKLPYDQAVKRRDFTINTLGLRFEGEEITLLDPLNGLVDLRDKILEPAGDDFDKDPVRFLRTLRFSQCLGFSIGPRLQVILERMDVSSFTPSYLWSEMQKSRNPISFYGGLLEWVKVHQELPLPLGREALAKLDELRKVLSDPQSQEAWMVALEWVGLSSEQWKDYFKLSSETSRRISLWAKMSKTFQSIFPESFQGDFEDIRERPDFEVLFDWYFTTKQILQKNPKLPLLEMIEEFLPHWIHLFRFEPVKDVKHIDPPFRAKYQVWNICQRL